MALILITIEDVKLYIPLYADYLQAAADARDVPVDDLLEREAELGEAEFLAAMPGVAAIADMTTDYTRHLVNIIHYNVFMIKHGDTSFDKKPAVVERYEKTKEQLDGGKVGTGHINVSNVRDRIMDVGFVDTNDAEPEPTSVPFQE